MMVWVSLPATAMTAQVTGTRAMRMGIRFPAIRSQTYMTPATVGMNSSGNRPERKSPVCFTCSILTTPVSSAAARSTSP